VVRAAAAPCRAAPRRAVLCRAVLCHAHACTYAHCARSRKQPGIAIGRLCEKCDGKCVICDSYVRPANLVRICDECNYGSYQGRCIICGGKGISDAYYCKVWTHEARELAATRHAAGSSVRVLTLVAAVQECQITEKDRDGCPKIVNLGSARTDLFYERKKYGFKKR
jgi:PHD finger-like domain-containing protein 5A